MMWPKLLQVASRQCPWLTKIRPLRIWQICHGVKIEMPTPDPIQLEFASRDRKSRSPGLLTQEPAGHATPETPLGRRVREALFVIGGAVCADPLVHGYERAGSGARRNGPEFACKRLKSLWVR